MILNIHTLTELSLCSISGGADKIFSKLLFSKVDKSVRVFGLVNGFKKCKYSDR